MERTVTIFIKLHIVRLLQPCLLKSLRCFLLATLLCIPAGLGGCSGQAGNVSGLTLSDLFLWKARGSELEIQFSFQGSDETPTSVHIIIRNSDHAIMTDEIMPLEGDATTSGIVSSTLDFSGLSFGNYELDVSLMTASGKTSNSLTGKFAAIWSLGDPIRYPEVTKYNFYSDTAIGDINGDGRNDVVVKDTHNFLSSIGPYIYLQNSSGRFDNPLSLNLYVYHIAGVEIADMNNDGRSDLIIAYIKTGFDIQGYGAISIYYQDNVGNLQPPVEYKLKTYDIGKITVADVDGDGLQDIIATREDDITTSQDDRFTISYQNHSGGFDESETYGSDGTDYFDNAHFLARVIAIDINNDGKNDLVFQSGSNAITVLTQTSPRNFTIKQTLSIGDSGYIGSFIAGDIDGDGRPEILTTYSNVPGISYYYNGKSIYIFGQSAEGVFSDPEIRQENAALSGGIKIADINKDGLNDIVCDASGGLVVVLQKSDRTLDATQSFWASSYGHPSWRWGLSIGDVNGDGWPDAVFTLEPGGLYVLPYVTAIIPLS